MWAACLHLIMHTISKRSGAATYPNLSALCQVKCAAEASDHQPLEPKAPNSNLQFLYNVLNLAHSHQVRELAAKHTHAVAAATELLLLLHSMESCQHCTQLSYIVKELHWQQPAVTAL